MDFGDSAAGALLVGLGPVIAFLIAVIIAAWFIRSRAIKRAKRRHRRHGYQGYVSYNPTADRTYLNSAYGSPPEAPPADSAATPETSAHPGPVDSGGPSGGGAGGSQP